MRTTLIDSLAAAGSGGVADVDELLDEGSSHDFGHWVEELSEECAS